MHIGTVIGDLRNGPLGERFEVLPELGVRSVEVWLGEGPLDGDFLEAVRKKAEAAGVGFWSVHASFAIDPSSPDISVRRRAVEDIVRCAKGIVRLGGKVVVFHASQEVEDGERSERIALALESIREAAEGAFREGAVLALENEPLGHLGDSEEELSHLLDPFPPEVLGLCWDTGHAHIAGEGEKLLRKLGDRLVTVHIHDNDGTKDEHLLPGYGTIDWASYMAELDRCGYEGPLMFEAGGPGGYEEVFRALSRVGGHLLELMGRA
ncbi:MAG: hypothetical protein DRP95_06055 [Candidatus Latescibacterota bacterium]|nr:MAG: hypothetical protein DRP95_06055 [Candidatus Latescibacterota bacterium]